MTKHLRCPQWISIRKKPLIKHAASSLVFAAAYAVWMKVNQGVWAVTDGLFMAAILMLMLGCWTLVRWLGLFDHTAYSWKKLLNAFQRRLDRPDDVEPMPDYVEYLQKPRVLPSAGEPLACFAVLMAAYLLLTYIL